MKAVKEPNRYSKNENFRERVNEMFNKDREAGILLHITSLPSKYGIGTVGNEAFSFIDFISKAGLKIWQILPLSPTSYGDSPYQAPSSLALNYYLIDLDELAKDGLLVKEDYEHVDFGNDPLHVDYSKLFNERVKCLRKAFSRFNKKEKEFLEFCKEPDYFDYGLFMTIKNMNNYSSWTLWPAKYKNYSEELAKEVAKTYADEIKFWQFTQYMFIKQWKKLKKYANDKGVEIMGDIPLYIGTDSVEVWKNPQLFIVDQYKKPILVSGCPPDAFCELGQLWGNPVYDWQYMKKTNYEWWNKRISKTFELVDILRIDHFRGFDRFYAIDASHINAVEGNWLDGPKFDLFKDKLNLHIVAEDLGFIDEGVRTLMRQTGYPGMKILEFAFDGTSNNEHKPSNYTKNFVVYTGTHDNMPIYQYIKDLSPNEYQTYVRDLESECSKLGINTNFIDATTMTRNVVELAFASIANTAIIPLQDFLAQGLESRMNLPSTVSTNNWSYRIKKEDLSLQLQNEIHNLVTKYRR